MRVCDYIASILAQSGVIKVYGLVGGGTAGLNDGFILNPQIEFVCFHHEQGAGHAAVGSARTNGKLSVVNVTTGCGGTNAVTSCLNAWQESVPVLFLSGNTKITNMASYINKTKNLNLRRYGVQEHDIVGTVKNMTKYATVVESVDELAYKLDTAIRTALSGRQGPVWLDIPADIQTADITRGSMISQAIESAQVNAIQNMITSESLTTKDQIDSVIADVISNALRPILIIGAGTRHSKQQLSTFIERFKIPFVTTFLTRDLIEYDHPQNIGMIGVKGNRAANFAMQNSDCLIILGCSMNVTHTGYDPQTFSPHSKKIMVDIDASELAKGTINIDFPVCADVKDFIDAALTSSLQLNIPQWQQKCSDWKQTWPIYDAAIHRPDTNGLNLYEIVESMNRNMRSNDAVVVDAGQPCYVCSTNLKLKSGQRYMAQAAQGDMGYAIPACVGIHFADPSLNIVLCIGEGSFYTNMQELAVIRQHNIPVKIFVINNDGYMSIKQTQTKMFGGRLHGVSKSTGVYFADIKKIADAFDIAYYRIENNRNLDMYMDTVLHLPKPIIVEFMSQNTLDVLPAQAFKPNGKQGGLHDMAPFLGEEQLQKEMIVKI